MRRKLMTMTTLLLTLSLCAGAQTLTLVKDINPSTDGSVQIMNSRDVLDGVVYFNGTDGTGKELWRTDGTASGTYQVKDIYPTATTDQSKAISAGIFSLNGKIYFSADNGVDGYDPWVSDGTTQGTVRLNQLQSKRNHSKQVESFVASSTRTYFIYHTIDFRTVESEYELWETDGSSSGTSSVGVDFPWIESITPGGSNLFMFAADGWDNKGSGEEPWISDGSAQGTMLIQDICPIDGRGTNHCDVDYVPTTVHSSVYAGKIWPLHVNGTWYFSKSEGVYGMELWKSDGTASGTMRITDINPGSGSSCPNFFTEMNGTLYFAADDGTSGMELWKYPLPNGPAQRVKDVASGAADSEPIWLTAVDGTLYFSAWTSESGRELWKSDGTESGTVLVTEIAPGSAGSNPKYDRLMGPAFTAQQYWREFAVLGGELYFAADDGSGYELWKSDGTPAGTQLVADVNPTVSEGSSPSFITPLCDRLLFVAYHPAYGNEWWSYGTGSNQAPVAVASASPLSGDAPLTVQFSSSGSYDPDGSIAAWSWDFGDNSSSSDEHPSHVYQSPGTYIAVLTVRDDCGATATDNVTITVTGTQVVSVHVAAQSVTRVTLPGNKIAARDVILIKDNTGAVVSGAQVAASYSGPTSGTVSGTTGTNGEVALETSWTRNPSGDWCFTVTDVQASGKTYDAAANVVTTQCEGTPKRRDVLPVRSELHPPAPNPFSASTIISYSLSAAQHVTVRVYDLLGRHVATIADGMRAAGRHSASFPRGSLSAGIYVVELRSGTLLKQQMLCIK